MKFSEVIKELKNGRCMQRAEWENEFITMQIPADISSEIVPKMQSLCNDAKFLLLHNGDSMIHYHDQVLKITPGRDGEPNTATSYTPTWQDIFADDWNWLIPGDE